MNTNNFTRAMEFVIKWEGEKFTNNPADPGGATKYGVTLAALKAAGIDKNADGLINAEDVKQLELADAMAVYREKYWDLNNCDKHSLPLCVAVMDSFVQHPPQAVKRMIDAAGGDWRKFVQARKDFYTRIIVANPKFKVFQAGWANRMNDLTKYCEILEQQA